MKGLRQLLAIILTIAAIVATMLAAYGFTSTKLFLEPERTARSANSMLSDPEYAAELTDRLTGALRAVSSDETPTPVLHDTAAAVIASRAFGPVFAKGIADMQRQVLSGGEATNDVDVTGQVQHAVANTQASSWAQTLPPDAVSVHLDARELPDLSGTARWWRGITGRAIIAALLFWMGAFVVSCRRARQFRAAGWTLVTTIIAGGALALLTVFVALHLGPVGQVVVGIVKSTASDMKWWIAGTVIVAVILLKVGKQFDEAAYTRERRRQ